MAVNVGTSVFGLKYKDGVMIAADTGITYGGSLAEKNASRMDKIGNETLYGCSGEMADFQEIKK